MYKQGDKMLSLSSTLANLFGDIVTLEKSYYFITDLVKPPDLFFGMEFLGTSVSIKPCW